MMTPQMLDRASQGFRRGYRETKNDRQAVNPFQAGTFAHYDWNEGQSAAEAEYKYNERMAAR